MSMLLKYTMTVGTLSLVTLLHHSCTQASFSLSSRPTTFSQVVVGPEAPAAENVGGMKIRRSLPQTTSETLGRTQKHVSTNSPEVITLQAKV